MSSDKDLIANYTINISPCDTNLSQLPSTTPKIICFYAEKGGVGKTTLCLNLAHAFAMSGKRVLIYDCDVQRSMTAWVFGTNISNDHRLNTIVNKVDYYITNILPAGDMPRTLYQQVISHDDELSPAYACCIAPSLYFVSGDRSTPKLDTIITCAEANALAPQFQNMFPNKMSSRPYHCIMKTAEHYKVDYVFLDLNPYPGTLNRCLIMSSHYIVIPACLDYFCLEMMFMMKENLKNWNSYIAKVESYIDKRFPWPKHKPKFLGYVLNMFMVYNKNSDSTDPLDFESLKVRNNQKYWAQKIGEQAGKLVVNLGDRRTLNQLSITKEEFLSIGCNVIYPGENIEYIDPQLGFVTEFYKLGDLADLLHVPIIRLTRSDFFQCRSADGLFYPLSSIEAREQDERLSRFKSTFECIKENMIKLMNGSS